MQTADATYLSLLSKLYYKLEGATLHGTIREDRTDVGTVSVFGPQMRFNLAEGFPILQSKKVHFPSVVSELLWFLKGDTNIKYLLEHNNHIWTDWRLKDYRDWHANNGALHQACINKETFEELVMQDPAFAKSWGDIGKGYGYQWRNFGGGKIETDHYDGETKGYLKQNVAGFDQISWVINEIKTNPTSRRLIVSGWNPHDVNQVDLPPCHTLFQFFVEPMTVKERKRWADLNYTGGGLQAIADYCNSGSDAEQMRRKKEVNDGHFTNLLNWIDAPISKLSCQLYQRSADVFLGVPFNIASYALLTHITAQACGLGVGEFVWTGGDVHLYSNHLEQAKEQLSRQYPMDFVQLKPFPLKPFDQYEPSDFALEGYNPLPAIKAPVAV